MKFGYNSQESPQNAGFLLLQKNHYFICSNKRETLRIRYCVSFVSLIVDV
jgi:hypothetical protein